MDQSLFLFYLNLLGAVQIVARLLDLWNNLYRFSFFHCSHISTYVNNQQYLFYSNIKYSLVYSNVYLLLIETIIISIAVLNVLDVDYPYKIYIHIFCHNYL